MTSNQAKKDTIKASILFEPLTTGVRCAAVDENGDTLWGYVAGKEKLRDTHQLVAIYDRFANLIEERLIKYQKLDERILEPQIDELRTVIKDAKDVLSALDATFAERNLKSVDVRAKKLEKVPAVLGALRDLLATLKLTGISSKTGKGKSSDELPLD